MESIAEEDDEIMDSAQFAGSSDAIAYPVKFEPGDNIITVPTEFSGRTDSESNLRQRIKYPHDVHPIINPDVNNSNTSMLHPVETNFENEPPLLEELGIDLDNIMLSTTLVLNPFKEPDASFLEDSDLSGPFVFSFAFGGFLLLNGKFSFGYVYCFDLIGCVAMYILLNLMSLIRISLSCTASVLGYCQLPLVIFSALTVIFPLKGTTGAPLALIAVLWCATPASKLFLSALQMDDEQQPLLFYPCSLVYGFFVLLIIY